MEQEKSIFVWLYGHLEDNETIHFEAVHNCATAYILKEGCKSLGFPAMTIVIYKPRLIYITQQQVYDEINKRNDLNKAFLIYGGLYEKDDFKVKPKRNMGKMKTMSYLEFMGLEVEADKQDKVQKEEMCKLIASYVKLQSIVENKAPAVVDRIGYLNPNIYYITSYSITRDGEYVECKSSWYENKNLPGASGEWCNITFRFPMRLLFASNEEIDNFKKDF